MSTSPSGLRTTAILHLRAVSGPSRIMRPRLERLAERGSLEVVVPGGGRAAESFADIATVAELPYEPLTFPNGGTALGRMAVDLAREARAFRSHLRRSRPGLVVIATATLPAALAAARLVRSPVIVEVMEIFDKGHVASAGRHAAGEATLRFHRATADALVCCSQAVAAQLPRWGRARVEIVYPGISAGHGEGDGPRFRAAHGLDGEPLIAVVGNVSRGRGQDLAVRALPLVRQRHPRAALAIVGEPHPRAVDRAYRAELERLARSLGVGDGVLFTGFLDHVADVWAAADVVVNPARFNEPFGQVAPEALVGGCPVVATRVGATPEVLRHGSDAVIVDPEDPGAIAREVTRLLDDPDLGRRMVMEGRRRVLSEFSVDASARGFERVADEVLRCHSVQAARR